MADKEEIRDLADDELEFYTDLALQESQRWIEVVTRKKFVWLDFCESLRNGVHLCQLLTTIWPGCIENINYDPKGGTENLEAFIAACQKLGLEKSKIFDPRDLLDNFIFQGDLLDRETQRRLLSITVTIYCLGKLARECKNYYGPHLDLSAFTSIVPYYLKHKEDFFKAPLKQPVDIYKSHLKDNSEFCDRISGKLSEFNHEEHHNLKYFDKSSSDDYFGKNSFESCRLAKGQNHSEDHFRDSSYGSLGSCDRGQFDEDGPSDMPGKFDSPFSEYSLSNATTGRNLYLSFDASYGSGEESNLRDSKWKQHSMDLSDANSDRLHDRYSSNDSLDGASRGSHHSRQVSTDSSESIPTRVRKKSSYTPVLDPLQFVKVDHPPAKPEPPLKTFEEAVKVKDILKEDEEQWQSNLDNWKSRRRQMSSKSISKDETEIPPTASPTRRKSKTFKEIMEERERRKLEIPYLGLANTDLNSVQSSRDNVWVSDDVFSTSVNKNDAPPSDSDSKDQDSKISEERKLPHPSQQLNGDFSDKDSSVNQESLEVHTSDSEQSSSKGVHGCYRNMTDEEDSNEEKSWSRIESRKNQRNESNLPQRRSDYWSSSRKYDNVDHDQNHFGYTKRVKSFPNLQSDEMNEKPVDTSSRKSTSMLKSKSSDDINREERHYPFEKIISITQRPRSGQTFGFTIKGGKEHKSPIFVDNVIPASAAALNDVKRGDEILSLNGVDMKNNFHTSAMFVIQQAIKTGCIEVKIRRNSLRGQPSGARALLAKKNKKDDRKSFDDKKKLFESQNIKDDENDPAIPLPKGSVIRKKTVYESSFSEDHSHPHQKLEYRRSLDVKKHFQDMLASLDKPIQKTVAAREPGSILDFVTDADRENSTGKLRKAHEDYDSLFLKTASLDRHSFNVQKYYAKFASESLDEESPPLKEPIETLTKSKCEVVETLVKPKNELLQHQDPIDVVYSSDNEASEEEKQYPSLPMRKFGYQPDFTQHEVVEDMLPECLVTEPDKVVLESAEPEIQRPEEDLQVELQNTAILEPEIFFEPAISFKPAEEEIIISEDELNPKVAPPTEKPPPPPKLSSSETSPSPSVSEEPLWPNSVAQTTAANQLPENASSDQNQGSFLAAKLRRINSTKRIRSEILRRRSDYFKSNDSDSDSNIDANDELWFSSTNKEIFVDDVEDTDHNSHQVFNRDMADEEEIAKKEREIIENLEREERRHLEEITSSNDENERDKLIKYHEEKEHLRHRAYSLETQTLTEQYEEQKQRIQEEESQWREQQRRYLEEFERDQKRYLEKEVYNAERARRLEEYERESKNKAQEYKRLQDDLWDRFEVEHQRLQHHHNSEWRRHLEEKTRDINSLQSEQAVHKDYTSNETEAEPSWKYHHGSQFDDLERHQRSKSFDDQGDDWNQKSGNNSFDFSRFQEEIMYAEQQQKLLEEQHKAERKRQEELRKAEETHLQHLEQERLQFREQEQFRKDEQIRQQDMKNRENLELLREKEEKLRLQEDLDESASTTHQKNNDSSAPVSLQVRVVRGVHNEPYFFVQRTDQERLRKEEERLREEAEKLQREREEHLRNVQAEKLRAEKEREREYVYSFSYEPLPGERQDKNFSNYSSSDPSKRPEWNPSAEEQKKTNLSSHPGEETSKSKNLPRYRPPPLTLTKNVSASSQTSTPPVRGIPPRVPPKPLSPRPPATPEEIERLELLRLSKQPTPSDEYKKVEPEDTETFSLQVEPLSKKSMHSLSAVPKAKIVGTEQWIEQYERNRKDDGRPRRKTDASRKGLTNVQDHWVVQEAEIRRLTEKDNRDRYQKLQNRNSAHFPSASVTDEFAIPPRQKTNRHSAHIMEKIDTQAPSEPKPYQPIPDSIIQSLTQRLNPGKLSNPSYNPPPQYSSHKPVMPPPPHASDHKSSVGNTESQQELLLSVSGKKKCSECGEELGRGAAMIIESLNLFYHLQCFKCCVCDTQLGNGSRGADVRVRHNKLHCHNCYSNDEAGLKLSKV